jgi:hypothetical protein
MPETWLWEAAYVLHSPVNAPKFTDAMLPLVFLKGVSDVSREPSALDIVKKLFCRPECKIMKWSCLSWIT